MQKLLAYTILFAIIAKFLLLLAFQSDPEMSKNISFFGSQILIGLGVGLAFLSAVK